MRKRIKIIDLLCLISNGEEKPKKIKYKGHVWVAGTKTYYDENYDDFFVMIFRYNETHSLNDEVEILDEEETTEYHLNTKDGNFTYEEDKDIPLIPDDELYELDKRDFIPLDKAIDFNFRVLKEKINQVVEEFNEYRKEEK